MSLREKLTDLSGALASITRGPDAYPSSMSYEGNKADIIELWNEIKPKLKRDLEQAEIIDRKLAEMFGAYESGDVQGGRNVAWALYNMNAKKLR